MSYKYGHYVGSLIPDDLLNKCSVLYSNHYGVWSRQSPTNPGERISLSPAKIKEWIISNYSVIVYAELNDEIIGYAIAIQKKTNKHRVISWVTQLVVHSEHRHKDIGKTLLFSIWGFSNQYAWGLTTASPYAVRALEKATRRRCLPPRIKKNKILLKNVGVECVPYVRSEQDIVIDDHASKINTEFYVDRSEMSEMLENVMTIENPWLLGSLEEGWEWFAFTFHDQSQISLTPQEVSIMLDASDQITKKAYSRMLMDSSHHKWAQYTKEEVAYIIRYCNLKKDNRILDLGCGNGRHAFKLAELGYEVTGIDYIEEFINEAVIEAEKLSINKISFKVGDCRELDLDMKYDAVICLYDVVGTYSDNNENLKILYNIKKHLRDGGYALISVMNLDLTLHNAKHRFRIQSEPDKLLELPASNIMEKTGDIFNPEYYMIDTDTKVVYRKEQFKEGYPLPVELIVRDRPYLKEDIERMCENVGLEVVWTKFVRAGNWDEDLDRHNERAKEILVLCRGRGGNGGWQPNLL